MEDNKARFLRVFRDSVKRGGSGQVLDWLCKSDFFTAPSSARHSGSYEGGLLDHSLNVYDRLRGLLELNGYEKLYSSETVAIVSLLHDVCKVNRYRRSPRDPTQRYEVEEKFPCGSGGEKSVIILQTMMPLSSEEILAIRSTMGGFDPSARGEGFIPKIFERSKLALLLHLADMEAIFLTERKDT